MLRPHPINNKIVFIGPSLCYVDWSVSIITVFDIKGVLCFQDLAHDQMVVKKEHRDSKFNQIVFKSLIPKNVQQKV